MRVLSDGTDYDGLAARMKLGEEASFVEFAATFSPRFIKYFLVNGMSRGDAEDLAVSCVTDIALKTEKYNPVPGADFRRWVFTIARHSLLDWYRYRRTRETFIADLPHDVPEDVPEPESYVVQAVRTAMESLPEIERMIVQLRHFEEVCSYPEIAERLHITPSAARARHYRALKRLRDLLVADTRVCNCLRSHGCF